MLNGTKPAAAQRVTSPAQRAGLHNTSESIPSHVGGDKTPSHQFFDAVFGGKPDDHYILAWSSPDKISHWHRDTETAATDAADLAATGVNVYTGVGLRKNDLGPKRRGRSAEVSGLVGLVADFDIAGPAHESTNLPPDEATIRGLIRATGLRPTVLVQTGHGIQAWWLFPKPWMFNTDDERSDAARLSQRWQDTVRAIGKRQGYEVDSVGDLARVLRVPGTVNVKIADEPAPVEIVWSDGPRYDPADFDEYLIDPEPEPERHAPMGPTTLDDTALLEKAFAAVNGPAIQRLWNGDTSAHGGNHSRADQALCNHLAFYAHGDDTQIDRLFRQSGLIRDKWDEVHYSDGRTYGEATVQKAVAGCSNFYSGAYSPPAPAPTPPPLSPNDPCAERVAALEAENFLLKEKVNDLTRQNSQLRANIRAANDLFANPNLTPGEKLTWYGLAHERAGSQNRRTLDSACRITRATIAARTGQSEQTAGRTVERFARLGVVRKIKQTAYHESGAPFTEMYLDVPGETVADMLSTAATLDPERPNTWGGKRIKCRDCGDVGTITRSIVSCAGCGQVLRDQTTHQEPDPPEYQDEPHRDVDLSSGIQDEPRAEAVAPTISDRWQELTSDGANRREVQDEPRTPGRLNLDLCGCGQPLPSGHKYRCRACVAEAAVKAGLGVSL